MIKAVSAQLRATGFVMPSFVLSCPPLGNIRAEVCRKCTYERVRAGSISDDIISEIADIPPELVNDVTKKAFISSYIDAVEDYIKSNSDIFEIPRKDDFESESDSERLKLPVPTYSERLVYEHTGLNFAQINELNYLEYRMLLADAVKVRILRREDGKGVEYLNECYDCMHQISTLFM